MAQFFQIHPTHPQQRLITKAGEILQDGGLIVYPTDSCYAFGCLLGAKEPMERVCRLRQLSDKHLFTLVCRNLSDINRYAKVSNSMFRTLKAFTPGPYTFLLPASNEVPRRLLNPKRRVIGVRVPDNKIAQSLIESLTEPLMSTTLKLPGDELPLNDPEEIRSRLEHHVDLVIDGGPIGIDMTTVVDLTGDVPQVVRLGKGDATPFQYD